MLQNATKNGLVPAKYYDIFGLRILGLTYKQIAEKIGYSEQHIRRLFAKGGMLYSFWEQWLDVAKEDSIDEAINMMFGHLPDIVRANILDAKMTNSPVAVAARKMIFEYTLGKPEERMKIDAKLGTYTFTDWVKAETLKEKNREKLG